MNRKESEDRLTKLLKLYHIWWKKLVDTMECPRCGFLIYKKERQVDYLAIIGNQPVLIECKQSATSFPFADPEGGIRPIQRQIMNDWAERGVESWIFLLMGTGKVLDDEKQAWLVSWSYWTQEVEPRLVEAGCKSLPWKVNSRKLSQTLNAQQLLWDYFLPYSRGKGFVIPGGHRFAFMYPSLYRLQPMPYWTMKFSKEDDSNDDLSNSSED